jgi:hypothetical protein
VLNSECYRFCIGQEKVRAWGGADDPKHNTRESGGCVVIDLAGQFREITNLDCSLGEARNNLKLSTHGFDMAA